MHSWNRTPRRVMRGWVIQSPEETITVITFGLLENERTSSATACISPVAPHSARAGFSE